VLSVTGTTKLDSALTINSDKFVIINGTGNTTIVCLGPSIKTSIHIKEICNIIVKQWHPQFHKISIEKVLGGLSNENYVLHLDDISYFVRCRYPQNDLLGSSLNGEWTAASIASAEGLAPKTVFWASDEGIMISEFINGNHIDLRNEISAKKFCKCVRHLHSLKVNFLNQFCPFDFIQKLQQKALDAGAELPHAFSEIILPQLSKIQRELNHRTEKVPCHLDLNNLNTIDDGTQLLLIDWEYSAMADPMFDLATAPSSEFFSDEEMNHFLEIYLERKPLQKELDEFYLMRILADIRTALWCYLQEKISPINATFHEGGDLFLKQILQRLNQWNHKDF
jgi:thiamine kinase-like enzyme